MEGLHLWRSAGQCPSSGRIPFCGLGRVKYGTYNGSTIEVVLVGAENVRAKFVPAALQLSYLGQRGKRDGGGNMSMAKP